MLAERRRQASLLAVLALDRGIEQRDDVAALYQERGRLHLALGDSEKARKDLTQAQGELKELLTQKQEAIMVMMGMLD